MAWNKNRNVRKRKRPGGGGVGIRPGSNNNGKGTGEQEHDGEEYSVEADIVPLPSMIMVDGDNGNDNVGKDNGDAVRDRHPKQDQQRRIRVVKPYPFTFATFAKARWNGRTVLDVYCDEFGSYPKLYYQNAIQEGRILVSGNKVTEDYLIKGGDELSHTVHRHEPAVAVCDGISSSSLSTNMKELPWIKVMHEDDNVIAVDKPSTMPIHPCGGYHFNSLFHILAEQNPALKDHLFTIHRLDRLTSGLTLIAKSTAVAATYSKSISDRTCEKIYLARVKGKFPLNIDPALQKKNTKGKPSFVLGERSEDVADDTTNDAKTKPMGSFALGYYIRGGEDNNLQENVSLDEMANPTHKFNIETLLNSSEGAVEDAPAPNSALEANGATATNATHWLHLACPCRILKHKNGVCEAGDFSQRPPEEIKGIKAAETAFALVGYDAATDSSLVMAKPLTGRTHQIRLHLEFMGHAIANDPNYGGDMFYANPAGAKACAEAKVQLQAFDNNICTKNDANDKTSTALEVVKKPENAITTDIPASVEEIQQQQQAHHAKGESESMMDFIKRTCVWCARAANGSEADRVVPEFLVRSPGLWLHALQYRIEGSAYRTDLPSWAKPFI